MCTGSLLMGVPFTVTANKNASTAPQVLPIGERTVGTFYQLVKQFISFFRIGSTFYIYSLAFYIINIVKIL